jgi:hypothetical protein
MGDCSWWALLACCCCYPCVLTQERLELHVRDPAKVAAFSMKPPPLAELAAHMVAKEAPGADVGKLAV